MTKDEIKQRFGILDVVGMCGLKPNRSGFIRCPFHDGDRSPSLKIYPDQNSWWCFGCNQGGDQIDFLMRFDGISFMDACRKLSGEKLDMASSNQIAISQMRREEQTRKKNELKAEINTLTIRVGNYRERFEKAEPFSDEWVKYCKLYQQTLAKLEHWQEKENEYRRAERAAEKHTDRTAM